MSEGPNVRPEPDVYTVMLILATVCVAAATIFLVVRSVSLFGEWNPF